jgi:hypothetical protein
MSASITWQAFACILGIGIFLGFMGSVLLAGMYQESREEWRRRR